MRRKIKITAKNKFHNTSSYFYAWGDTRFYITRRQYKYMWSKLCGTYGCCCGVELMDGDGNLYSLKAFPLHTSNSDTYELIKE